MIGELPDRDMREQSRTSDAAFDRSAGCRRLDDAIAAGARLLAPHMTDDLECRIDDFQLLGNILAQRLEIAAACRTGLFCWFQYALFAGPVRGQRMAHRFLPRHSQCRLPLLGFTFLGDQIFQACFNLFDLAINLLGCSISSIRMLNACSSVDTDSSSCRTSPSHCSSSCPRASTSITRDALTCRLSRRRRKISGNTGGRLVNGVFCA